MKFRQYVPTLDAKTRLKIAHAHGTPFQADDYTELMTTAQEMHAWNRRPFYRVYPGVTAAMLRLGIEKIDISNVCPPVNGLALEFAEGYFINIGHIEITGLMVADLGKRLYVGFVHADNTRSFIQYPREYKTLIDRLKTMPEDEQDLTTQIMKIVFGVCMIPQTDSDLIKPLVLNRDKEKYESTGDVKFIERARRNGVNGWEVGQDIPTPEEMETFRQQQSEPGRKSPHWRMGHFAIRYTGEGRSIPVVRWIKETFVNKDLWKEVPHGYYGEETADS
jgi:hypothetical protein